MAPGTKRRKHSAIAEISFDDAAREDYLTGFHKRKQARIKAAQGAAAKREKEERLEERRQIRERRKEELERHVQEVNTTLREVYGLGGEESGSDDAAGDEQNGEEWKGFEDPPVVSHEDEYIDEDKFTTVAVEAVDVTREGLHSIPPAGEGPDGEESSAAVEGQDGGEQSKKKWTKERPVRERPKKKTKKFRYESKAERKASRVKERAKNHSQAKARRGTK